jgi:aryl carrier-like protein
VVPSQAVEPVKLIQELRSHLETRLPQYMQPSAIVLLESLPRTLNGKVDRQALPAPQPEQMMSARKMVYPRSPKEEILAEIWAKALGVKEVGVEDSIFDLGGDSLMIFRITTQANQRGLALNARHIFEHRTIAAICSQLGEAAETSPKAGIQAVSRTRYRRPQELLR